MHKQLILIKQLTSLFSLLLTLVFPCRMHYTQWANIWWWKKCHSCFSCKLVTFSMSFIQNILVQNLPQPSCAPLIFNLSIVLPDWIVNQGFSSFNQCTIHLKAMFENYFVYLRSLFKELYFKGDKTHIQKYILQS